MGMGRGGRGGGAFRCNQPCCVRKPCRQQPELLLPGFVNGHCSVRGAVATASLVQCRLHHHNSHTPTIAFRHPPPKEFAGFTTTATLPPSLSDTLLQRSFAGFTTTATLPPSLSDTLLQRSFAGFTTTATLPPSLSCTLLQRSLPVLPQQPHSHHRFPAPSSKGVCRFYHNSHTPTIAFLHPPPKEFAGFTTTATLHASLSGTLLQRSLPVLPQQPHSMHRFPAPSSKGVCRFYHNSHTPTIAFLHPPPKEFAGFTTTATLPPSLSCTLLQRSLPVLPQQPHSHHRFPAPSSKGVCRFYHNSHTPTIAFLHPPPKEFAGFTTTATLHASLSGTLLQRSLPVLPQQPHSMHRFPAPSSKGVCRFYHNSHTPTIAFLHPPPKEFAGFTTTATLPPSLSCTLLQRSLPVLPQQPHSMHRFPAPSSKGVCRFYHNSHTPTIAFLHPPPKEFAGFTTTATLPPSLSCTLLQRSLPVLPQQPHSHHRFPAPSSKGVCRFYHNSHTPTIAFLHPPPKEFAGFTTTATLHASLSGTLLQRSLPVLPQQPHSHHRFPAPSSKGVCRFYHNSHTPTIAFLHPPPKEFAGFTTTATLPPSLSCTLLQRSLPVLPQQPHSHHRFPAPSSKGVCRFYHNSHTPCIAFRHPPPKEFAGFTTTATLPPSLSCTLLQRSLPVLPQQPHSHHRFPAPSSKGVCRFYHNSHTPTIAFLHPPPKEFAGFTTTATLPPSLSCTLLQRSLPVLPQQPHSHHRFPAPSSKGVCRFYHNSHTPTIAFLHPPPKEFAGFTTTATLPPSLSCTLLQRSLPVLPQQPHSMHRFPAPSPKGSLPTSRHQPHSLHHFPAPSSKRSFAGFTPATLQASLSGTLLRRSFAGFTTPATLRASLSGTLFQRAVPVLCSAGFTTPASLRASLSGTLLQSRASPHQLHYTVQRNPAEEHCTLLSCSVKLQFRVKSCIIFLAGFKRNLHKYMSENNRSTDLLESHVCLKV